MIKQTVKKNKLFHLKKISKIVVINLLVSLLALLVAFPFYLMFLTSINPVCEGLYF